MDSERQQKKSERLKRYFGEITLKMIKSSGMDQISIRNIAKEAGYSYATIYNHFSQGLDELLWLTRSLIIEEVAVHMTAISALPVNNLESLSKVFVHYGRFYMDNPEFYRFIFFRSLNKEAKTTPSLADAADYQNQFMKSFQFLLGPQLYSMEELSSRSSLLLYSIHGILTLAITDNDDLEPEQVPGEIEKAVFGIFEKARMLPS